MKKCAICGKSLESGAVVHSECIPRWRDPKKEAPPAEEVVIVLYSFHGQRGCTTGVYEDGTISLDESIFSWEDAYKFEYDEERDEVIIPKSWWEDRSFGSEVCYQIDCPVIGWMPLPSIYGYGA